MKFHVIFLIELKKKFLNEILMKYLNEIEKRKILNEIPNYFLIKLLYMLLFKMVTKKLLSVYYLIQKLMLI